jgi:tRNA (guanine10-N2)-methyltransferase
MKYFASFYRKYLYLDFCLPELISICEMLKVKLDYDKDFSGDLIMDPIVGIDIEGLDNSDIAQKIIDRSVLTKYIVKIYSTGSTFDQLVADLDKEEFLKESLSEQSFKFDVNACGRVMSEKEKLSVMEKFGCLNFKGKVNIKNAERTFVVLDNHKRGVKYFGRMIAGKEGNYNLLIEDDSRYYSKYNLQARKYLGPTSTDNVLAFLMVYIN